MTSAPPPTFYKPKPNPRSLPPLRASNQPPISIFLRKEFTEPASTFSGETQSQIKTSSARPTTSKRAKVEAKVKYNSTPRLTEEQLRAQLKKDDEERKEQEARERLVRAKQVARARNKRRAEEKKRIKMEEEKGRQKEGQMALTRFFAPMGKRWEGGKGKEAEKLKEVRKGACDASRIILKEASRPVLKEVSNNV